MRVTLEIRLQCGPAAPEKAALDEMAERLLEERDVTVVRTAVWKLLNRHGQTQDRACR